MKKILFCAVLLLWAAGAQASQKELIESVKQGNLSSLLELLDSGDDVNAANEQGNTALHYAVALDNADITQVLLAYGANLNAANNKGWTPYSIAQKKQLKNVTPIIEKAVQEQKEKTTALAQNAASDAKQKISASKEQISSAANNVVAAADKKVANINNSVQNAQAVLAQKAEQKPTLNNTAPAPVITSEIVAKPAIEVKIAVLDNNAASKAQTQTQTKTQAQVKAPAQEKAKQPSQALPKVVLQKSKIIADVYAGDEEIAYCLNYLGHGENESMLHGAGFFAASAGINEERYQQIASKVESYLAAASQADLQKRSADCGAIITPKNAEKQNQIIRSINRGIGI